MWTFNVEVNFLHILHADLKDFDSFDKVLYFRVVLWCRYIVEVNAVEFDAGRIVF